MNQSYFHLKGVAQNLVLKPRQKVTRKWPIHFHSHQGAQATTTVTPRIASIKNKNLKNSRRRSRSPPNAEFGYFPLLFDSKEMYQEL